MKNDVSILTTEEIYFPKLEKPLLDVSRIRELFSLSYRDWELKPLKLILSQFSMGKKILKFAYLNEHFDKQKDARNYISLLMEQEFILFKIFPTTKRIIIDEIELLPKLEELYALNEIEENRNALDYLYLKLPEERKKIIEIEKKARHSKEVIQEWHLERTNHND